MMTLSDIRIAIEKIPLPSPLRWYANDTGGILLPLYGSSGGVSTSVMAVLLDETRPPYPDGIDLGRNGMNPKSYMRQWNPYITGAWYVVECYPFQDNVADVEERIRTAVAAMTEPRMAEATS